jgi:hypothetical protein
VYMIVYNARQYETSRGINRFIDCHLGTRPSLCYCYDILTVDDNGTVSAFPYTAADFRCDSVVEPATEAFSDVLML